MDVDSTGYEGVSEYAMARPRKSTDELIEEKLAKIARGEAGVGGYVMENVNLAKRQQDFEFLERRAKLAVEFWRTAPRDLEVMAHAAQAIIDFLSFDVLDATDAKA